MKSTVFLFIVAACVGTSTLVALGLYIGIANSFSWSVYLRSTPKIIEISKPSNQTSECGEILMTEWSGTESRRKEPLKSPVDLVIIQHTASSECFTDEDCTISVNNIRNYHLLMTGFTDLGYSFMVGGNGKIYEGAGWKHMGAHTKNYNKRSLGISFIGDFRKKTPNPVALGVLSKFLACGVEKKLLTEDYHLVGHQQLSQTLSPGAALQSEIQTWPHWLDNARNVLN